VIKRLFIAIGELEKKYYTCSWIVLVMKFLRKVEWDLKRVLILIQIINNYSIENKYYLTE
jgi:hypothetical protein